VYYLGRPALDDENYFLVGTARGAAKLLRRRRSSILSGYLRYRQSAPKLSPLLRGRFSDIEKELLVSLFDKTVDGALTELRYRLKSRAVHCPMCLISAASHLDHFLPKSAFQEFSIYSLNLVPICPECNLLKGEKPYGRFLNAYFDRLRATVLKVQIELVPHAVRLQFSLLLKNCPRRLRRKVRAHFEELRLQQRHALMGSKLIGDLARVLPSIYASGGSRAVRGELQRNLRFSEVKYGPNFWECALYRALIASRGYCDDGFHGL
jgi:hypothetical protein